MKTMICKTAGSENKVQRIHVLNRLRSCSRYNYGRIHAPNIHNQLRGISFYYRVKRNASIYLHKRIINFTQECTRCQRGKR